MSLFQERKTKLTERYEDLVARRNIPEELGNGIFERYQHPVLTAAHAPLRQLDRPLEKLLLHGFQ